MKKLLLLLVLFTALSAYAAETVTLDFRQGLKGWKEKKFSGQVEYQLVQDGDHQVLQAQSKGQASALIYWLKIDPHKYSRLRWRWKIERVLEKGQAGVKAGDDYPARIYIVFDSWLPNFARSINYIWASKLAAESVVVNPYYRRSIMLAVESGSGKAGQWVVEERDLVADYRKVFGGDIPRIRAIAVMTDGDNTGESVFAWFDWIEFTAEKN